MPENQNHNLNDLRKSAISQPLVTDKFTADPSAHLFNGKIYIYPSHDIDAGIPFNDNGDHFGMRDYHVYSMDSPDDRKAKDLGKILDIDDVPWAKRQMWAPDIAENASKYFFYFPAKDHNDIFRIGVAIADSPTGPFTAEKKYIEGSYSIDPAIFNDNGNLSTCILVEYGEDSFRNIEKFIEKVMNCLTRMNQLWVLSLQKCQMI